MCSCNGPTNQLFIQKNGHTECHIWPVACTAVGVVMHNHVAGVNCVTSFLEHFNYVAHVAWNRPRLEWCRHFAFAHLQAISIRQCSAKILRFANDRRIGHAHQFMPHLYRDAFKTSLNYGGCYWIDAGHDWPSNVMMILPDTCTQAVAFGGITVVLSFCKRIAGPSKGAPIGIVSRR